MLFHNRYRSNVWKCLSMMMMIDAVCCCLNNYYYYRHHSLSSNQINYDQKTKQNKICCPWWSANCYHHYNHYHHQNKMKFFLRRKKIKHYLLHKIGIIVNIEDFLFDLKSNWIETKQKISSFFPLTFEFQVQQNRKSFQHQ